MDKAEEDNRAEVEELAIKGLKVSYGKIAIPVASQVLVIHLDKIINIINYD